MNSSLPNRQQTPSVFTPLGDSAGEPPTGPSQELREALLRDQAELEREVVLWQRWVRYIAAAFAGAAILLTSGTDDLPGVPLILVASCYVLCVAAAAWIVQRTPADRPRAWLPALLVTADLVTMGEKVQAAKKLAPTRPHPSAPHSALFHKTIGPGVGMIDRLRDALSGRRTG